MSRCLRQNIPCLRSGRGWLSESAEPSQAKCRGYLGTTVFGAEAFFAAAAFFFMVDPGARLADKITARMQSVACRRQLPECLAVLQRGTVGYRSWKVRQSS